MKFISGSRRHFLLRKFRWVLLSVVILTTVLSGRSSENPPNPREPIKQLIDGNFKNALAASQACVDYYKAQTANLKPDTTLSSWQPLNVLLVGYHLCAKAQIQTMMEDTNGALKTIMEAEKFSNVWSNLYSGIFSGGSWPDIINVTKGFYFEKTGDIASAKKLYIANPNFFGNARLAVLALSNSPDQEVREWADKALGDDPPKCNCISCYCGFVGKGRTHIRGIDPI
jgi:hypothetical protein